jgi:hypothetical protein
MEKAVITISLNISFVVSAIDDFSKTMDNLESRTRKALDAAGTIGAGFTVAGAVIGAGLGVAVNTAADFQQQMSRVKAISGATDSEFAKLQETAMNLGASTSKSASEIAVGKIMPTCGETRKYKNRVNSWKAKV